MSNIFSTNFYQNNLKNNPQLEILLEGETLTLKPKNFLDHLSEKLKNIFFNLRLDSENSNKELTILKERKINSKSQPYLYNKIINLFFNLKLKNNINYQKLIKELQAEGYEGYKNLVDNLSYLNTAFISNNQNLLENQPIISSEDLVELFKSIENQAFQSNFNTIIGTPWLKSLLLKNNLALAKKFLLVNKSYYNTIKNDRDLRLEIFKLCYLKGLLNCLNSIDNQIKFEGYINTPIIYQVLSLINWETVFNTIVKIQDPYNQTKIFLNVAKEYILQNSNINIKEFINHSDHKKIIDQSFHINSRDFQEFNTFAEIFFIELTSRQAIINREKAYEIVDAIENVVHQACALATFDYEKAIELLINKRPDLDLNTIKVLILYSTVRADLLVNYDKAINLACTITNNEIRVAILQHIVKQQINFECNKESDIWHINGELTIENIKSKNLKKLFETIKNELSIENFLDDLKIKQTTLNVKQARAKVRYKYKRNIKIMKLIKNNLSPYELYLAVANSKINHEEKSLFLFKILDTVIKEKLFNVSEARLPFDQIFTLISPYFENYPDYLDKDLWCKMSIICDYFVKSELMNKNIS